MNLITIGSKNGKICLITISRSVRPRRIIFTVTGRIVLRTNMTLNTKFRLVGGIYRCLNRKRFMSRHNTALNRMFRIFRFTPPPLTRLRRHPRMFFKNGRIRLRMKFFSFFTNLKIKRNTKIVSFRRFTLSNNGTVGCQKNNNGRVRIMFPL